MIRRSTVVYIIILLALAGAYLYLKTREKPTEDVLPTPEATEEVSYLFTAEQGVPTSITIQSKAGDTVELARGADGAWMLAQPFEANAEQGSSEAAATQVTTMRILEKVPDLDPKVAGVDDPEYLLTVKFGDKLERTVKIGIVTPSESGYYVQDAAGGDIVIVSKNSVDAILTLLTTPPYLETPTPSPVATETPLLTPTPVAGTPTNETVTPNP